MPRRTDHIIDPPDPHDEEPPPWDDYWRGFDDSR